MKRCYGSLTSELYCIILPAASDVHVSLRRALRRRSRSQERGRGFQLLLHCREGRVAGSGDFLILALPISGPRHGLWHPAGETRGWIVTSNCDFVLPLSAACTKLSGDVFSRQS